MTTGEKIAILRRKNGITQEQLAEQLHVSRQSVSRWEMDVAFPEVGKLLKLSRLLDCSVDFLLNEEAMEMCKTNIAISIYDCYKFIRDCGYFFLATSVNDKPNLRPMGWIYSNDKALFIATDKRKKVYTELMKNPQVELASYNFDSARWIRVSGELEMESSILIRQEMMSMYSLIKQDFRDKDIVFLAIFKMNVENIVIK